MHWRNKSYSYLRGLVKAYHFGSCINFVSSMVTFEGQTIT